MKKEIATSVATSGYLISEDDHLLLTQVRNQLRLLTVLSSPRSEPDDDYTLDLSPAVLAQNYEGLHTALDTITRNAQWHAA